MDCRLPANSRQIPKSILLQGSVRGALFFGFQLGTGVMTYLCATMPYVLAVAVVMAPASYPDALAAGTGFGLGRGVVPALRLLSRDGQSWDEILYRRHGLILRLSAVMGALTIGLIAAASRG
jgi:hypothetical protein